MPTLLPLFRLVRDQYTSARQSSALKPSGFTRYIFGQSNKTSATSQKPLWESRKPDAVSNPQKSEWGHSATHQFNKIENSDGDLEMQIRILPNATM